MLGEYKLNEIYNEDCYQAVKKIPDKSVDLIIIDPPYQFTGGGGMTGIFKDRGKRYFNAIEGSYETKCTVYRQQANVEDKKLYVHPTIKPLEIIKNLILNSSHAGG